MNTILDHIRPCIPGLGLFVVTAAFAPASARADSIDCYAPTVTITAPADGATVEGDEVAVTVVVASGGGEQDLAEVYVLVDGEKSTAMAITAADTYTLQVPVTVGEHELVGAAFDDCAGEGTSEPITITVTAASAEGTAGDDGGTAEDGGSDDGSADATEGDTATDGASSGDDDGDDNDDDDDDEKSGCSVDRVPTRSWVGMSALLLTVVGASRLRRRAGT
jgi:hypothetical protein